MVKQDELNDKKESDLKNFMVLGGFFSHFHDKWSYAVAFKVGATRGRKVPLKIVGKGKQNL